MNVKYTAPPANFRWKNTCLRCAGTVEYSPARVLRGSFPIHLPEGYVGCPNCAHLIDHRRATVKAVRKKTKA